MILANRKESNKQSLSEKIYIFYLAITYFSTIHISVFKVFSMYTDYVCLFFLLFMILSKGSIKIRDLLRTVSALAVFSMMVYLNKGGVGSVITILSAYLMFLAFPKKFTDKGKREIIFFASVFIFFAFYRSFSYRADWYYHRFNDVNPNTMGMYVLYSMAILVSFLDLRQLNNKILIFVCLVISLVSLLNYEARACLVATILVTCVLLPICRKINKKILFFVILLIVLNIIGGEKYVAAYGLFRWMIPILFFSFPAQIYGWPTLGAIGKVKETTLSTIIAAVAQVTGLLVLIVINKFTLVNLAILRGGTESILMAVRMVVVYRNHNLFNCGGQA